MDVCCDGTTSIFGNGILFEFESNGSRELSLAGVWIENKADCKMESW